jgi:hypothetical protein
MRPAAYDNLHYQQFKDIYCFLDLAVVTSILTLQSGEENDELARRRAYLIFLITRTVILSYNVEKEQQGILILL